LHAEAALQAGQPETAVQSIILSLDLAAALGSRSPEGTRAISFALRETARPLRAGIARHQWRAEDLGRIATKLQSMDLRQAVRRDVDTTLFMLELWERWKEDRRDFENQSTISFEIPDAQPLEYEFVRNGGGYLLPRGWFDWNAAKLLRTTMECRKLAMMPGPVSAWAEGAERMRKAHYSGDAKTMLIAFPHATRPLAIGARATLQRDLMLAACMVERSYLEQDFYPPALPSGIPEDPYFARPFAYLLKPGGGFEVYSVGPNGTNDSDRPDGKRRGDDLWW
jgi:hypothetical protein